MTTALVGWISGRLHEILGYSETSVAQYIGALAAKSSNLAALHTQILAAGDIQDSPAVRAFAQELFARVQSNKPKQAVVAEKKLSNAELVRQSQGYELLGDEDEGASESRSERKAKKESRRKEHIRKRDTGEDPDKDEPTVILEKRSRKVASDEKGPEDELEEARAQDLEERDAFVDRLRAREAEKTKKIEAAGLSEAQVKELATRGTVNETTRDMSVLEMRELSRRLYLAKREAKEVTLTERQLEDEAEMFDQEDLSAAERLRLEMTKKVIEMTKDRDRFETKLEGYHIPDSYEREDGKLDLSKREAALTARYEEEPEKQTEEDQWMDAQGTKAVFKPGAKDKKTREETEGYEYVFDDQIEFVLTQQAEAKLLKKTGDEPASAAAEEEVVPAGLSEYDRIQINRKKLPSYAYR